MTANVSLSLGFGCQQLVMMLKLERAGAGEGVGATHERRVLCRCVRDESFVYLCLYICMYVLTFSLSS